MIQILYYAKANAPAQAPPIDLAKSAPVLKAKYSFVRASTESSTESEAV